MRLSYTFIISLGLFAGGQAAGLPPSRSPLTSRGLAESQNLDEATAWRRDLDSSNVNADQPGVVEDDYVDDEESDYTAGVYEHLSAMLDQIQPSVDEIETLSNNANDMNADEYADKLTAHLNNISDAGDSLADQMSSDSLAKREITPNCPSCDKKEKPKEIKKPPFKPKHCEKCKKRSRSECGSLLWKFLKACKASLAAIKACKIASIRRKCHSHLLKVTGCFARVVLSCGKHGISQSFQSIAQVDIRSFSQITQAYGFSKFSTN